MTLFILAAWGAALVGASAIDTWLASLVVEAMRHAGLSQDYVSRVTRIPPNKLSDQLAGKVPFTGLVRFGCREIREDTEFWMEFTELLADRMNRCVVPVDLGRLVAGVEELVGEKRRMVKMAPVQPQQHREAM